MSARSAGDISFTVSGDTSLFATQLRRDLNAAMARVTARINLGNLPELDKQMKRSLASTNSLSSAIPGLSSKLSSLPMTAVSAVATGLEAATAAALGLGVAIATVGLKSASSLQNTQLAIEGLGTQLKDISADDAINSLRELSIQSGISLDSLTAVTQSFVAIGNTGKGSLALVNKELGALAKTGALNIKSVEGVARALQQIQSKPLLQVEELNQLSDQAPAVFSRTAIMEKIAAKNMEDLSAVQERFRLGTQQSGDALTAVVEVMADADKTGDGLDRRLKTLGGAFSSLKQRATLALGDLFNEEGGVGSQLAGIFNNLDVEGMAQKIGKPVADALATIVPAAIEALPDIVNGIAFAFKMLTPIVVKAARAGGQFAAFFTEHQDAIENALSNIGDLMGGIATAIENILPAFKPVIVQLGIVLNALGALGRAMQEMGPVFRVVGNVMAAAFDPFTLAIDVALHGIEQLLEGVGLIPSSIPFLGNVASQADAAAAKIHNLRNELMGLSGASGQTNKPGFDDLHPIANSFANKAKPTTNIDNFKLPTFANTGAGLADAKAAKAAEAEAKRLAKALESSLETLNKDLNKYAKRTGQQSFETIRSNYERLVDDMKDAIEKANAAGNKATAKALETQLKRLQKGNKRLLALAKQRDAVNDKLTEAKDNLKNLKDESRDFMTSIQDSIKEFGNITRDSGGIRTTFIGMRRMLTSAVRDTLQFKNAIQQLQAAGLNETSLRQIVDAGPEAGLATAKALAKAGPAGGAEINNLQKYLESAGKDLATGLNNQFYTAGIQVAQGIVSGLQSQEAALVKAMDSLADKLVKSIKTKLKIHSPSGVFEDEVGAMLPEGAARGIYKRIRVAEQASAKLGNQTIINFGANAVAVNGVADPNAAQRSGVYAGEGISDVVARRMARKQLAGEG
jgi:hypothetical protein